MKNIFIAILLFNSVASFQSCHSLINNNPTADSSFNTSPEKWPHEECYFYYGDSSLNFEDDDHTLYSPLIRIKYTGEWSDYNLRQLDSMFTFCRKHDECELAFDIVGYEDLGWNNADSIAAYINKKLQKENMLGIDYTDCKGHNKGTSGWEHWDDGFSFCLNRKTMVAEQKRDKVYFIFLTKPTSSNNCCR